jgi:4-amino-4-deoxy-L-arabinose transferase-like glycosyltransferase
VAGTLPHARAYFWVFAILAAILLLAPLRTGDLTGYDDAQYAQAAKEMVRTGDWIVPRSNGEPSLENTPMIEWMQAALFSAFGLSDSLARLPSALCGLGTILLVYWLARRLTGDPGTALVTMLVMASSIYFLKYAARGMTDVPFTFFTLCAVCAWSLTDDDPRWYLAAGLAIACAQMTRSMMGLALPAIFVLHLLIVHRRPAWRYALPALALAYLPIVAWYAYLIRLVGASFFEVHSTWLRNEAYGGLTPAWRRYTGAFEYAWMLSKSYWPWLPPMLAGILLVWRKRDPQLTVLIPWVAVVFLLCAAARSRVLRYMLPAYPAFAILAAVALVTLIPPAWLRKGLRIAAPVFALAALALAAFPHTHWEAAETRAMALAATAATKPGERVGFYDDGQPRHDEANQLLWYGDRYLLRTMRAQDFQDALAAGTARVWIMDTDSYQKYAASRRPAILAQTGHLICIRLAVGQASWPVLSQPQAGWGRLPIGRRLPTVANLPHIAAQMYKLQSAG